ncbi:hypothetical protein CORT_0E01950 [Candida orthopsilosis Co 90-125]|uniref:Uncharacterized protein n=1 Tax=Candida orthopsilosis (strain 90-125) TaxID=1136231 RepID=H8X7J8_CANO9|nr:hypothetical protein CORT_0E01950 [Candida orthopsilosis Co 90-125]CCG23782.1 hypothetical protein CORT_0E01950 [Candida orthopsilosis Co 90-125]
MQIYTIPLILLVSGVTQSAIIPFRDSVEIVFTPEDIKKGSDYVLWKVPTVKNNFKTTVKQKLLNRLLSKDLQELRLNSPFNEEDTLVSNSKASAEDTINEVKASANLPLQNISLEVEKPKGLVNSVLKGPSATEKTQGKVRYINEKKDITQQTVGFDIIKAKEKMVGQVQKEDLGEHVGYSKPSNIKNRKHDFDRVVKSPNGENKEDSDTDYESK